ncbi:MAG: hypothetical protein ACP5LT_00135 [Candidatus Kapaibacteriota bacterium]
MKQYLVFAVAILMFCNFYISLATTANPNRRACEPECCRVLPGGYLVYYCFPTIATCNVDCNITCKDPEMQQYRTYFCNTYIVEFELCKRHRNVFSTNGCDIDETGQIEGVLNEHANGTCPYLCAQYYTLDCTGFFFVHSCTFRLK